MVEIYTNDICNTVQNFNYPKFQNEYGQFLIFNEIICKYLFQIYCHVSIRCRTAPRGHIVHGMQKINKSEAVKLHIFELH